MLKQTIVNLAKKLLSENTRRHFRKLNWQRMYFLQSISLPRTAEPVHCPIAEKDFKTFIKVGSHLVTPSNGARNRQRLVWLFLKNEVKILKNNLSLLHIAPEASYFNILKSAKNLIYTPGDKMMDGYSYQPGITNVDLTELPYQNESFDVFMANHVLEHIPDDALAISEIYRILKKDGKAVITVPINEELKETYENEAVKTPTDRAKHFGQWDHVRWYGVDIKNRFEKAGFKVNLNRYAESFSEEEYSKYGLCKDLILEATK
ncbi:MAG: methyltransferase domain-containing protein [Reichenbachiella sp.]